MSDKNVELIQSADREITASVLVPLDRQTAADAWKTLNEQLAEKNLKKFIIDLAGANPIDSAGVAVLRLLEKRCQSAGIDLEYRSVPTGAEYFLSFKPQLIEQPQPTPFYLTGIFTSTGLSAQSLLSEVEHAIRFVGETLQALFGAATARHFYWNELLYYTQRAGSEAMPIIFLLSFLLGLVMSFQAAVQLRQFGANIYVADLLSLALSRELAPVFTAVILAGRSGSSFAAEIGTMKINEEVDALTVMGFDVTRFVVLPKILALAVAGPLLTIWANVSGLAGGVVVGVVSLDLTPHGFLAEAYNALQVKDLAGGLLKSFVFSLLIGLTGCFRGLQTEKGADSVGRQTTSAVVTSLFLIIFADAIFTISFHYLDW